MYQLLVERELGLASLIQRRNSAISSSEPAIIVVSSAYLKLDIQLLHQLISEVSEEVSEKHLLSKLKLLFGFIVINCEKKKDFSKHFVTRCFYSQSFIIN